MEPWVVKIGNKWIELEQKRKKEEANKMARVGGVIHFKGERKTCF